MIFTDGSLDSINSVLHCLNDFSKCSGLKINCEKSIDYKIDSLIGSDRQYGLIERIQWSTDPIKTLGVVIPIINREQIYELNYLPPLKKIEAIFKQWAKRKLSIQGKVCIIKTLAISQLVYLCAVLPSPPKIHDYGKQVENLIFKFL